MVSDLLPDPKVLRLGLTDYFGNVYVLASACISNSGIALPKGTLKEVYFSSDPEQKGVNNKEYIVTKEIVDCIRKYKHNIKAARTELMNSSGDLNMVIGSIRQKLGYDKTILEETDMWVAGHLEEIFSMSCEAFLSQYAQDVDLGKGDVVVNFKTYANQLLKCTKSRTKKDKLTLKIVRGLDEGVAIEEVRETLKKHLSKSRGELTKAYKILMLAREHNHKIPTDFKKVLKG